MSGQIWCWCLSCFSFWLCIEYACQSWNYPWFLLFCLLLFGKLIKHNFPHSLEVSLTFHLVASAMQCLFKQLNCGHLIVWQNSCNGDESQMSPSGCIMGAILFHAKVLRMRHLISKTHQIGKFYKFLNTNYKSFLKQSPTIFIIFYVMRAECSYIFWYST